jgi:hypothetical protein
MAVLQHKVAVPVVAYCNGYTQGYVYAWNVEIANQNGQSQQLVQQQQCNINNSPGAVCSNEQSSYQNQSHSDDTLVR